MEDFDALLAELAPLSKAMAPADGDAKISDAAEEGGNDTSTEGEEEEDDGKADGSDEDGVLGKSFSVTLPDGTVQEAFDASGLVKSFSTRLDQHETAQSELSTELGAAREDLAKALTFAKSVVGVVKGQAELIKALQADVARIGSQPTGRKAVVSLVDKPSSQAPRAPVQDANAIMAKAMTANAAGQLMAADVARLEASFNSGLAAPADILARLPA